MSRQLNPGTYLSYLLPLKLSSHVAFFPRRGFPRAGRFAFPPVTLPIYHMPIFCLSLFRGLAFHVGFPRAGFRVSIIRKIGYSWVVLLLPACQFSVCPFFPYPRYYAVVSAVAHVGFPCPPRNNPITKLISAVLDLREAPPLQCRIANLATEI